MSRITRRDFFRASTGLAAGAAVPKPGEQLGQPAKPSIKRKKPLGKTGWMVGDISAGARQREPALIEYLFECGMNLIDTEVGNSGHEQTLGKILPKWRNKVFVIDKWATPLVTAKVSKAALLEALDVSLKTLNTTYIDCMMIHGIGSPRMGGLERIQNPAIYEAWDEAKKLGKVRFTGASSHSVRTIEEIGWGIDNNRFDIVLVGANFLTRGIEPVLKRGRAKGVGLIAMKTFTIYKSDLNIRELMNQNTNARQACLKWVLASDLFDTIVISMENYDRVSEYLAVSGTTSLTAKDRDHLRILEAAISNVYCRPGCDRCFGICPKGVPIWDVLRYKMYFEHYGNQKIAMEKYCQIPVANRAGVCGDCAAPCEPVCPYGLPVRQRLLEAHHQLTLA